MMRKLNELTEIYSDGEAQRKRRKCHIGRIQGIAWNCRHRPRHARRKVRGEREENFEARNDMKHLKRENKKVRTIDLDKVSVSCYILLFLLRALGDKLYKIGFKHTDTL
jgi:hypothetical protein